MTLFNFLTLTMLTHTLLHQSHHSFALTCQVSQFLWEAFLVVWKASLTHMGLRVDYAASYGLV